MELSVLGRYDTVFVSPHLDDIALSCPGRVLEERARGRRVLIATIFSDVGPGASAMQAAAYAARREEESAAVACLGVDSWMAGLPDAPWRSSAYRSHLGIAFGHDLRDTAPVHETVAALLRRTAADRVFAPMSVGNHIDHRLCQMAVAALAGNREVWYYEDRPYALVDELLTAALIRLRWRHAARPLWARLRAFVPSFLGAHYVRCDLRSRRERTLACLRWAVALLRAPRGGAQVETDIWHWDRAVAHRAMEAMACYRSQLTGLYGSAEAALEATMRYGAVLGWAGGYAERFWRPRLTV